MENIIRRILLREDVHPLEIKEVLLQIRYGKSVRRVLEKLLEEIEIEEEGNLYD